MTDPVAVSVRQRLLNLSRKRKQDFQLILTHFAIERLLYRLSQTPDSDRFLLKGAMLFNLWSEHPHRPTRDLDLSGVGEPTSERLQTLFRTLCAQSQIQDGLFFDPDSLQVTSIREQQEYDGLRVHLMAHLAGANIPLQVDIGFGDVVIPPPSVVDYPTLLDFPAPRLRAYPKETVVAEKTQALVALGIANSRMKDFYDLWFLASSFPFEGQLLADALAATFSRRKTEIPESPPIGLTEHFYGHSQKQQQWKAFLSRSEIDVGALTFGQIVETLRLFLLPALTSARSDEKLSAVWENGSWRYK